MRAIVRTLLTLLFLTLLLRAQNLKEFEKKVTEFTLANGLHFIVLERHDAPVVSFHTYVNAGSVDDPGGKTGLAHMFEHMAFKGTRRIGTRDFASEQKAMAAVEAIYDQLEGERNLGVRADPERIRTLEASLHAAIGKAASYVDANAYVRIIEENGGVGMNAGTGMDSTNYFYSLPSNRIELWFLLESRRFLTPVFREFYKERDVVREERRMRVESSPQGKLMEVLLAMSFMAHPYRNMPGGWAEDIEGLRVRDAEKFFSAFYVPVNMTIAIAGDVLPAEAKRLAEKYFGLLPKAPPPAPVRTVEPKQEGERRGLVESPAQPTLIIGYKRPDQLHKDDPVFDVLASLLSSGRTGMLYRDLVRDRRIALAAAAEASFPATKYPNLFLLYAVPSVGHTVEENEKALYGVLERLKSEKVDPAALERVKTKIRAGLIRSLDSNSGLAGQLTYYHANYGDWRKLFTGIEDIQRVTGDDVQRVAREYFTPEARTVAWTARDAEVDK
ncbi:MAG: insulinase family protein [Bryobacterales bacterium]|nr:insulinase family protein [Bryobacterales bacterium]